MTRCVECNSLVKANHQIDSKHYCFLHYLKKRKRQVRDALNKCQSLPIVEQIGKLLNVM